MTTKVQMMTIIKIIENEREKIVMEIAHMNGMINKKKSLVEKMSQYQSEYYKNIDKSISSKIPSLCKNYYMFLDKLESHIQSEIQNIQQIDRIKNNNYYQLCEIDNRIKALKNLVNKLQRADSIKKELIELEAMDELSILKIMRGRNG